MPVKLEQREYRAMPVLAPGGPAKRFDVDEYVEGYATTFGNYYQVNTMMGSFEERIMPSAIIGCDMRDVVFQFQHEGRVFARTKNGSLVIEADQHGLFIAADLSRTTAARDFFEDIRAENIDLMSWAFIADRESDEWTTREDGTRQRTINRLVKAFDVSGVTFASNDATEISARSLLDGVIEQEGRSELARKALALRLRL